MKTMRKIGFLCCVLLIGASAASAIPIGLDTDPLAMAGQQGLTHVSTSGSFICDLTYAVYDLQAITYNGFDPSWGQDKYLYAYQVFNLGNSTVNMSVFSVLVPQGVIADNIAYDGSKGQTLGIPSSNQQFAGGSAVWRFDNHAIVPGKNSVVLLFTSNFGPGTSTASFEGDQITGEVKASVVSPVPEPVTLALLGIGAITMFRKRSR